MKKHLYDLVEGLIGGALAFGTLYAIAYCRMIYDFAWLDVVGIFLMLYTIISFYHWIWEGVKKWWT